jgi:hypothetical protein
MHYHSDEAAHMPESVSEKLYRYLMQEDIFYLLGQDVPLDGLVLLGKSLWETLSLSVELLRDVTYYLFYGSLLLTHNLAKRSVERREALSGGLSRSGKGKGGAEAKPVWSQAPSWANWLAQDGNGNWWWYENPPIPHEISAQWDQDGQYHLAKKGLKGAKNWNDSLEGRPCY